MSQRFDFCENTLVSSCRQFIPVLHSGLFW